MMNQDVLEQIFHLPIAERIEIIEKVSRSVREDLKGNPNVESKKILQHLNAIITRNTKDFAGSNIKIYSPTEFLQVLKQP
jgi:hypothetical protein